MVRIDEQAVGQVGIGLAPNELGRIEFGRVAGKLFHLQPGMLGQKILDGPITMDRSAIPERNNRPGNLRHQRLEKPMIEEQDDGIDLIPYRNAVLAANKAKPIAQLQQKRL